MIMESKDVFGINENNEQNIKIKFFFPKIIKK